MSGHPNDWVDFRDGDEFPTSKKFVRALDRPLKTPFGFQEQFVALAYRHGLPLIGRAWKNDKRIQASFADNERELSGRTVGPLQILAEIPPPTTGFVYEWKPFSSISKHEDNEWNPVHIGFITPCVIYHEDCEILGSANLKEENAQATTDGKVVKYYGSEISDFPVLCRKACSETMKI